MVGADIKRQLALLTTEELQVELTVGDIINLLECADSRFSPVCFRSPLEQRIRSRLPMVNTKGLMSFIEAVVAIRRGLAIRIQREQWFDNQYIFCNGAEICSSPGIGGVFIDDILHADWKILL